MAAYNVTTDLLAFLIIGLGRDSDRVWGEWIPINAKATQKMTGAAGFFSAWPASSALNLMSAPPSLDQLCLADIPLVSSSFLKHNHHVH